MIVVDSGGPWLSKTANNLPVSLYCIMTACKDRPDIKGGEIAYNSKVLWGTRRNAGLQ